jgi:hypothetical protein
MAQSRHFFCAIECDKNVEIRSMKQRCESEPGNDLSSLLLDSENVLLLQPSLQRKLSFVLLLAAAELDEPLFGV